MDALHVGRAPETEKAYDGTLLYSRQDEAAARALYDSLSQHGSVSIWFHPVSRCLGKNLTEEINAALESSRYVLVCLGASLGGYQNLEISTVLSGSTQGDYDVIPVFIPGFDKDLWFRKYHMLREKNAADLSRSLHHPTELGKLVATLSVRPRAAQHAATTAPMARALAGPAGPAAGHEHRTLRKIADAALANGMTFIVGPTVPDRHILAVPNPQAVAAELLQDLGLIDGSRHHEALADPLMSTAQAAFVYALKNGQTAAAESIKKKQSVLSVGQPASYVQLARLLAELEALRASATVSGSGYGMRNFPGLVNLKWLVVTTNIDLSLERAFLKACVPFTRAVLHCRSRQVLACAMSPVYRDANGLTVIGTVPHVHERAPAEVSDDEHDWIRVCHEESAARSPTIALEEVYRTYEMNRLIREAWASHTPVTVDDLPSLPAPVVLKINGSYDIEGSTVSEAQQSSECGPGANEVMDKLLDNNIAHNPAVLLGFSLTEPDFVHLFDRWLRRPWFELASTVTRAALLEPPTDIRDGQDRIYQVLADALETEAPEQLRVTPIRMGADQALTTIGDLIARRARESKWRM
jgi:hypothetical protein